MSSSVPESAADHGRADWENAQPLGIYRSLNTRLAQGQLSSQLQFIQPLGIRSLSVLQPQLFSSDPTFVPEAMGQPFEDFPFFETPVDTRKARPIEQTPAPRLQQASEATTTAEPEAISAPRSPLPPATNPSSPIAPSISESLQPTADAISGDSAEAISEGPEFSPSEDDTPLINPSTESSTSATSAQATPENVHQEA
ncbi:MAG: hypothetical protein F6K42_08360, partial [Leptolyngbya sp. SIO1D8]|nr:hypothetical protein [Leptolyngbya sp. SIO1D8]